MELYCGTVVCWLESLVDISKDQDLAVYIAQY